MRLTKAGQGFPGFPGTLKPHEALKALQGLRPSTASKTFSCPKGLISLCQLRLAKLDKKSIQSLLADFGGTEDALAKYKLSVNQIAHAQMPGITYIPVRRFASSGGKPAAGSSGAAHVSNLNCFGPLMIEPYNADVILAIRTEMAKLKDDETMFREVIACERNTAARHLAPDGVVLSLISSGGYVNHLRLQVVGFFACVRCLFKALGNAKLPPLLEHQRHF